MLLACSLPAFAQIPGTTDVIPIGGKWIPILGKIPFKDEPFFDNLQAACEFDFNFKNINLKPVPACRIPRLSGRNIYLPLNQEGGFGFCYTETPKRELKIIDGKYTFICGESIEDYSYIMISHKSATCPAPANGQRAAATDCECPVKPLKPITDPETLRFENGDTLREDKLASSMKTKLACLRNAVSKAGGTLTVNSAWRPIGYQEHFYEIFTKFNELKTTRNKKIAACKPIRDQVIFEKNTKHGIQGKVAKPSESRHEKGLAFDASWSNITTAKLDALLPSCNLTRPFKKTDKIHFQ
jgi:hypothetical protein